MVSEAVRFIESFLPRSLHWWTDWYAANPEWFAGGLVAIAVLMSVGTSLSGRIKDGMRVIWQSRAAPVPLTGFVHDAIYVFRTNFIYQGLLRIGKRHVVPFLLAAVMVWYSATLLSHFLFNAADSMGAFCKATPKEQLVAVDKGMAQPAKDFDTSSICAPTGLTVRPGFKYEILVTMTMPWEDDGRQVTPVGYRTSTIETSQRWKGYAIIFLRRILFRPWFRLIARVGETGVDEYFLDPIPVSNTNPQVYRATLPTVQRSGEIFLYVNDAVIGSPWLSNRFYKGNKGTAKVTVRLL